MAFRYVDGHGQEHQLANAVALVDAIRAGRISDGTPFCEDGKSSWTRAIDNEVVQVAKAAAGRAPVRARTDARITWEQARWERASLGVTEREHGLRGKLYIWFLYLSAGLFVIAGLLMLVAAAMMPEQATLFITVGLIIPLFAVLQYALASALGRFRPWSRIVILVMLWLGIVGGVLQLMFPDEGSDAAVTILGMVVSVPFIHYFHSRKDLFTPDAGA